MKKNDQWKSFPERLFTNRSTIKQHEAISDSNNVSGRRMIQLPGLKSNPSAILLILVNPLLTLIAVQWISFGSVIDLVQWIIDSPFVLLVNYAYYISVLVLICVLISHMKTALILYDSLFLIYAVIDRNKFDSSMSHFSVNDLFKSDRLSGFLDVLRKYMNIRLLLRASAILILLVILTAFLKPHLKMRWYLRAALFLITGFVLFQMVHYREFPASSVGKMLRIPAYSTWDPNSDFKKHGLLPVFFSYFSIAGQVQVVPVNYENDSSAEQTAELLISLLSEPSGSQSKKTVDINAFSEKPTIIVLASEALWDITRLNGLKFDVDPFGHFRNDYVGDVVSGVFGGQTANAEFEFLTGFSLYYLNPSTTPFLSINRETNSLAKYMKKLGYVTTAIHTFGRSFYNRSQAFPKLGFDFFISEEMMTQTKRSGWYLSDQSMTDQIIRRLDSVDGPQFIYALTMQNHGPYYPARYKDNELAIRMTSMPDGINLTEGDTISLLNYAQGTLESGMAYKRLKEYCQTMDRPVIILTFGDHLPAIGQTPGVEIYSRFGLDPNQADGTFHSVPVMLWSSGLEKPAGFDRISFNFLQNELLAYADLPLSEFHLFMYELSQEHSILTVYQRAKDIITGANDPSRSKSLLQVYEYLQYDLLWGDRRLNEFVEPISYQSDDSATPTLDRFNDTPLIKALYPDQTQAGVHFNRQPNGQSALAIAMQFVHEYEVIVLNGESMPTSLDLKSNVLTCLVPEKLIKKQGQIKVQVINQMNGQMSEAVLFLVN